MRKTLLSAALLTALAAFSSDEVTAFSATWKEDVSKSTLIGQVVQFGKTADGKLKIVQTDKQEFVYDLDGKPHPDASRPGALVTTTNMGDTEFTGSVTRDGQFEFSSNRRVSSDGKHLISTIKQRNADGEVSEYTMRFDRVSAEKQGFWGTWKIVSMPPKKPTVMHLQVSNDGTISFSQDSTPRVQCNARMDGKDYPVSGYKATMSFVRTSGTILTITWKELGNSIINGTWTLSDDHRILTELEKRVDGNELKTIYNRQK